MNNNKEFSVTTLYVHKVSSVQGRDISYHNNNIRLWISSTGVTLALKGKIGPAPGKRYLFKY